jgi:hypothetical protein
VNGSHKLVVGRAADGCPAYNQLVWTTSHEHSSIAQWRSNPPLGVKCSDPFVGVRYTQLVSHYIDNFPFFLLLNRGGKAPIIHAGGPIWGMIRANESAVPSGA